MFTFKCANNYMNPNCHKSYRTRFLKNKLSESRIMYEVLQVLKVEDYLNLDFILSTICKCVCDIWVVPPTIFIV